MKRASVALVSLLAGLLGATACADRLVGTAPKSSNAEIFELLWKDFDRFYSMFELRGVDWADAYQRYQPTAASAPTADSLRRTLVRMMSELKDPHVGLSTSQNNYYYTIQLPRSYFDPRVAQGQLSSTGTAGGGRIRWGKIGADVGYVYITSFSGEGWGDDIDVALTALGTVKALVLDVRSNGGGSDANAKVIAGRFVSEERKFSYVRYRNGRAHGDLSDPLWLYVVPLGNRKVTVPVYLLTNRQCASSTEEFVLMLSGLPNVTVVGDTTLGASGAPIIRELPNGWTYRFSQWIHYRADGSTFEGVGLAPHIVVKHSAADSVAGIDRQLAKTLDLITQR